MCSNPLWRGWALTPPAGPGRRFDERRQNTRGSVDVGIARRDEIALRVLEVSAGDGSPRLGWAMNAQSLTDRSRSELTITDTELRLMAALATIGDSSHPSAGYNTPAASGIPSTL